VKSAVSLPITNLDLPADSVNLLPRLSALTLKSDFLLDLRGESVGPEGPASVNSYVTLFSTVAVPEPMTNLLLGMGLFGLSFIGRRRQH